PGVGVDRHHLHAVARRPGQHDRRAPSVGPDLHDPPPAAQTGGALPQHGRLVVAQPSGDVAHGRQGAAQRVRASHEGAAAGTRRPRSDSASMAEAARNCSPSTSVASPTRLRPALDSSSGSSAATMPSTNMNVYCSMASMYCTASEPMASSVIAAPSTTRAWLAGAKWT